MAEEPSIVDSPIAAVDFILWCVGQLAAAFHPDTSFEDYLNADGEPSFDHRDVLRLDDKLEHCFEYCDAYEVGHRAFVESGYLGEGLGANERSPAWQQSPNPPMMNRVILV